ncbi:MAG: hypothetical protein ACFBSG_04035 [Leptolyngbyaceae cyanobacterium]
MTTVHKDSQQLPLDPQRMNSSSGSSVVISLLTGPFLVALMSVRALSETLTQLGIASEEFFRGERLPNLQTPSAAADSPDADTDN